MLNYLEYDPSNCNFYIIEYIDKLSPGDRIFVEIDDLHLVLFNISGEIFAIGDICSHDDGPLGDGEIDNFEIICPRHGARFDIRTGKATSLPAIVDIPAYPVRLNEGQIEVGIPSDF